MPAVPINTIGRQIRNSIIQTCKEELNHETFRLISLEIKRHFFRNFLGHVGDIYERTHSHNIKHKSIYNLGAVYVHKISLYVVTFLVIFCNTIEVRPLIHFPFNSS